VGGRCRRCRGRCGAWSPPSGVLCLAGRPLWVSPQALQALFHPGARGFAELVAGKGAVLPVLAGDHLAAEGAIENARLVPGKIDRDITTRHGSSHRFRRFRPLNQARARSRKILPGFMIPSGSSAALIVFIVSTLAPCSRTR